MVERTVQKDTSNNGDLPLVSIKRGAIQIIDLLEDPDHYKGPKEFQTVVDYGGFFVERGFQGHIVPESERWSERNLPPEGIKIYEFSNPNVATHMRAIESIAENDFYTDPRLIARYYANNNAIFKTMKIEEKLNVSSYVFMSLVRGGILAGEFLGVSVAEQVLIQTKRLHLSNGGIAIGLSYEDPEDRNRFNGKNVLIGDPAGATYASTMAAIIDLIDRDIHPRSVVIMNTVASQKGAMFAKEVMDHFSIPVNIISGGCSYRMDKNFYLETSSGTPSIRDAGDGLNAFLPVKYQL